MTEHHLTGEEHVQLHNLVQEEVQHAHQSVRNTLEEKGYTPASFIPSVDDPGCQTWLPGEKMPGNDGEATLYVLMGNAKATEYFANRKCFLRPPRSSAGVCLEKRFNVLCGDTPVASNNAVTLEQQTSEEQVLFSPMRQWMTSDDGESVRSPVCFSSNCYPESAVKNSHAASFQKPEDLACAACGTYDSHPQEATVSGRTTRKTAARRSVQSPGGRLERRERHNSKERLRRKKIRSLCNELNTLVPSCTADTDTVNTLQSTCTFLKYIKTLYGDNLTSVSRNDHSTEE
ncbi:uncharacterized protein LOC133653988 [Entelurus aequoreus]|uniref:uncharacterized protein LOC133653988 n=1 Tax=Entelurus aequoreus TaxID=161455 RepID=UPI002B1E8595|nr:uncharacterized protein LOC133653988 [Entelurus aequoreus]XP_061909865.1 uncharacterized protein LOC133653988 [Entelurus aequoreus]XP_061909866.1 uncharacterized protein LOC133653988 [Entelurus aequoreus]